MGEGRAMTIYYLDADGPLRLLLTGPADRAHRKQLDGEAVQFRKLLDSTGPDDRVVSSKLLEVEVLRALRREGVPLDHGIEFLTAVGLFPVRESDMEFAARLPIRSLRTLDALHLVAALRIHAHVVLSYDSQLVNAARDMGLDTMSPGSRSLPG